MDITTNTAFSLQNVLNTAEIKNKTNSQGSNTADAFSEILAQEEKSSRKDLPPATHHTTKAAHKEEAKPTESTTYAEATKAFLDYMDKTPEERYREAILRDMDLTEEQLAALPPEERAKVEEEIKAQIEKRIKTHAAEKSHKEQSTS